MLNNLPADFKTSVQATIIEAYITVRFQLCTVVDVEG